MRVGERRADELNRHRSITLRTAYVFYLGAKGGICPDQNVREAGLRSSDCAFGKLLNPILECGDQAKIVVGDIDVPRSFDRGGSPPLVRTARLLCCRPKILTIDRLFSDAPYRYSPDGGNDHYETKNTEGSANPGFNHHLVISNVHCDNAINHDVRFLVAHPHRRSIGRILSRNSANCRRRPHGYVG